MNINIALLTINLILFSLPSVVKASACFSTAMPTKIELSKPIERHLPQPGAHWTYSSGKGQTTEIELTSVDLEGIVNYKYTKTTKSFQEEKSTYSDINPERKGKKVLIQFPLKEGAKWEDSFSEKGKIELDENTAATYDYEEQSKNHVVGVELIRTAAGTFNTFRIIRIAAWRKTNPVSTTSSSSITTEGGVVAGYTRTDIWYAPSIGRGVLKAQRTAGSIGYLETNDVLKMADTQIIELIAYSDEINHCKTEENPSLAQPGDVLRASWQLRMNDTWEFFMQSRSHQPFAQKSNIPELLIDIKHQPSKEANAEKLPTADELMKIFEDDRKKSGRERVAFDREKIIALLNTSSPPKNRIYQILPIIPQPSAEAYLQVANEYFSSLPVPSRQELLVYRKKLKENLIFFPKGSFWMGDFGWRKDKWAVTGATNDDPPHKVKLSSFVIMKHQVTYADYDLYIRTKRLPPLLTNDYFYLRFRFPDYPAGKVTWQQAEDFCGWLGEVAGQPFRLPTEAQWEYAARSGGREVFYASTPETERNMDAMEQMIEGVSEGQSVMDTVVLPSGLYPPNRAGVYDMSGYGSEWVRDWYAPYGAAVKTNPIGPASGQQKVIRRRSRDLYNTVLTREAADPQKTGINLNFRCAAITPKP